MIQNGSFRTAILFFAISALLHVAASIISGFSSAGLQLLAAVPVLLIMIWGLSREWRWFAYLCFLVAAILGIIAMSFVWSENAVQSWVYLGIMIADWLAAAALFLALWRSRPDGEVLS